MYNDELDIYNQDYFDMDDHVSEDASIFNEDYFDTANEALKTSTKFIIADILGGQLGQTIGNLIHSHRMNKSTVINKYSVISIYGEREGTKRYEKAVKFLQKNGFIAYDASRSTEVPFSMLTPRGKEFMEGYYAAIDEIDQFDMNKARSNMHTTNNRAIVNSISTGVDIIHLIAVTVVRIMTGTGILGILDIVTAMVSTSFNISELAKLNDAESTFKGTMAANAYESAFNDSYFETDEINA